MGNTQAFESAYSIPVKGTQTADLTPILRAATHPDVLVDGLANCDFTNRCIGYRKRSAVDGSLADEYTWLTYNEIHDLVLKYGSALLESGDCMDLLHFEDETYAPAKDLRLLGIFSKNRLEWLVSEQAANAYDFSIVPLYDTLGYESLKFILEKTRMRVVASSLECLSPLLKGIESTGFVKYVVLFLDPHEKVSEDLQKHCEKLGLKLLYFDDLVNRPPDSATREPCPGSIESINTVCYTSGTTGCPKGVLLTHRNVISCTAGILRGPMSQDFHFSQTDSSVSYLPLAHVLERLVCNAILASGAAIGMYSGDTGALLDDIRCLKPTVFVSVPRLFNRIDDAVFRGVAGKSPLSRFLFNRGMNHKLERLRSNAYTTNRVWDSLVFSKTRSLMGNNLRYMISGGAPLDAIVQEHMKVLFCAPLMEGYGLTETFGPAFLANPRDPVSGHVGGVVPCCEFRLKSVPEMNYTVNDCPPRGELLMRGHAITVGYFRDSEETAAALDDDGWFHTGDIAVILPGGRVKIIDRHKNIFKLAQGEYVAPEKLEAIYIQAPFVSQIFAFGYSDKNYVVAIVVPDRDVVASWAQERGVLGTVEELVSLPDLKSAVIEEMETVAKEAGLKGFEKVKRIHLEAKPFTVEEGLLTPTLKLKRHYARKKFEEQINEMYELNSK